MAPPQFTSRSVAGTDPYVGQCSVVYDDEVFFAVLSAEEVGDILTEMAKFLNDWRTQIDLAKDFPEQYRLIQKILDEFGGSGRAYTKVINGQKYVVLKGYAGLRTVFRGTKYLANNAKVVSYGIGRQGTSIARGNIISIFLLTGFNVLETIMSEDKDFIDASAQFTTDVAKTAIGGVVAVAVGAAGAALSAPVVVTVGAGIVIGIMVAYALDAVDSRWEITKTIEKWYREVYEEAKKEYEEVKYEFEINWNWCNSPEGVHGCMRRMFGGY